MTDKMKQILTHLVLIIFEKSFHYLHQYFDIMYDIDCDEMSIVDKKE